MIWQKKSHWLEQYFSTFFTPPGHQLTLCDMDKTHVVSNISILGAFWLFWYVFFQVGFPGPGWTPFTVIEGGTVAVMSHPPLPEEDSVADFRRRSETPAAVLRTGAADPMRRAPCPPPCLPSATFPSFVPPLHPTFASQVLPSPSLFHPCTPFPPLCSPMRAF